MRKMLALALAMVMTLAMSVPAFAAYQGDTQSDNTFRGTADGTVSVGGLKANDNVKFYKILAYDDAATTKVADLTATSDVTKGAGGWKVIAPFATGDNAITGLDLKAILTTGITDELAGKIAKNATGDAKYTKAVAAGETVATAGTQAAPVDPGLYVAIIEPANAGEMFNPVFVASDYFTTTGDGATDQSSNWTVDTDLSYSNRAMAKKADITVTKTAAEKAEAANETDGAKAVGKGDTVDFTIDTTIPEFADNYTAPVFVVSDTMTSGLEVVEGTVKVYASDGTTELPATTALDGGTTRTNYTVTVDQDKKGYKVSFNSAYLLTLTENTAIKVKYSALVTEDAVENVHVEDNTVTVEYSHKPDVTSEGQGKKVKDKTHHYSFTIDGNIFGDSTYKTTEVVKIGLDKDGNEITQTTTLDSGKSIGALAGAEFKLYITDPADGNPTEYNKGAYAAATATDSGNKIVSDANGRLTLNGTTDGIPGLDAGTYWLVEEKAPAGYIKQQAATKIEIIPTFYQEVKWTDADGSEITCDDVMKSYIVKIDGAKTAEYVLHYAYKDDKTESDADRVPVNDVTTSDAQNMKTTAGDIVIGNSGPITTVAANQDDTDDDGKILNTQGTELPSTGGMGTTILYLAGTILVLGAGILLVTRRRMSAQ